MKDFLNYQIRACETFRPSFRYVYFTWIDPDLANFCPTFRYNLFKCLEYNLRYINATITSFIYQKPLRYLYE